MVRFLFCHYAQLHFILVSNREVTPYSSFCRIICQCDRTLKFYLTVAPLVIQCFQALFKRTVRYSRIVFFLYQDVPLPMLVVTAFRTCEHYSQVADSDVCYLRMCAPYGRPCLPEVDVSGFGRAHGPAPYGVSGFMRQPSIFFSPPNRRFLFCSRSIWAMLLSGVGRSSGMVPPSSAMVWRTFLPTV